MEAAHRSTSSGATTPRRRRGWLVAIVAAALAGAIGVGFARDGRTEVDETCDSTVYEGCPSRWEAEWADPPGN